MLLDDWGLEGVLDEEKEIYLLAYVLILLLIGEHVVPDSKYEVKDFRNRPLLSYDQAKALKRFLIFEVEIDEVNKCLLLAWSKLADFGFEYRL